MKAYVSGYRRPETGADMAKDGSLFELLEQVGFDVVAKPQDISEDTDRIELLCGCLKILDSCDVIFMMSGWRSSRQSQHEYDFAIREGKIVLFEESFCFVDRVKDAILKVMGMQFESYSSRSRVQGACYARMIFVHHCRADKMKLTSIAKLVGRDHTTMLHYLKRYSDEVKYNSTFRKYAENVEALLYGSNPHTEES